MDTEQIETPTQLRFFGYCVLTAVAALFVTVQFRVNAWLLLPIALVVLTALSGLDGYRSSRT
jgi:uncharacterized protein (DUF983 family)